MPDSRKKPKDNTASLEDLGISLDASLQNVDPESCGGIFSFFSGAGFLDLGFEEEGFVPVMVNEYHPPFLAAYKHSRSRLGIAPPSLGYLGGSIEALRREPGKAWLSQRIAEARDLGKPVGFVGGPPCPDFSNAGKHRGKDGEHGRLTKVYVDLIRAQLPDFFVFENVKGLLRNHAEHLREIEQQLGAAGYRFATRLANGLEYGVPQDRERVVIIGFHKRLYERAGQILPRRYRLGHTIWHEELLHDIDQVRSLPWPGTSPFGEDLGVTCPEGLRPELTVQHWFRKGSSWIPGS
ncbi:DNA cytosine methyltransferase [Deinococcus sp. MIMF12]|uniref:DNA (cytosine-5-)-methyltransferase n=1 Tax=Deinococcus rhizophilus TaxID=3049544 RepID=A0ABT7JI98_9DEIO|nr:DNA cytosine methyltransferase [Deinococcus rhizophilus]MDL2344785.1 DNA cytosine methyltransferase [Deinococcus rhizophilus]